MLSLPPMDMEKLTEEPEWIFPYDYMAVGESFFIPTLRPAQMIYMADIAAKKSRIKVKIFTCEKEGHLGVRVWRTA
jgi:hypothetical protein